VARGTVVTISWIDNSTEEDGFSIERRMDGGNQWTEIAKTGRNARSVTDSGIQIGKTYFYRVRAFRGTEFSQYSNEDAADTLAPPAGVNVSVR
jgi:titin